jgi:hypothetical protein
MTLEMSDYPTNNQPQSEELRARIEVKPHQSFSGPCSGAWSNRYRVMHDHARHEKQMERYPGIPDLVLYVK